jgi:hypothetical protein
MTDKTKDVDTMQSVSGTAFVVSIIALVAHDRKYELGLYTALYVCTIILCILDVLLQFYSTRTKKARPVSILVSFASLICGSILLNNCMPEKQTSETSVPSG